MGGNPYYGLWGSNVKTGKYLPRGWQEQISYTFLDLKIITWEMHLDFGVWRIFKDKPDVYWRLFMDLSTTWTTEDIDMFSDVSKN